jgi:hypothetical protein
MKPAIAPLITDRFLSAIEPPCHPERSEGSAFAPAAIELKE